MKEHWINQAEKLHREQRGQQIVIREGHLGGTDSFGDASTWFPEMWDWLIREFDLKSMMDVGCGVGHAMTFFHGEGLNVLGIDGADGCRDHHRLREFFVQHDLCNGPYIASHKYDIVWSCEFLEHVDEEFIDNTMQTFVKNASKVIAVTASNDPKGGHHHVNAQPREYWINHFSNAGWEFRQDLTNHAIKISPVPGMGRQYLYFNNSGMIFVPR